MLFSFDEGCFLLTRMLFSFDEGLFSCDEAVVFLTMVFFLPMFLFLFTMFFLCLTTVLFS